MAGTGACAVAHPGTLSPKVPPITGTPSAATHQDRRMDRWPAPLAGVALEGWGGTGTAALSWDWPGQYITLMQTPEHSSVQQDPTFRSAQTP